MVQFNPIGLLTRSAHYKQGEMRDSFIAPLFNFEENIRTYYLLLMIIFEKCKKKNANF